jgi:hypothetical protein
LRGRPALRRGAAEVYSHNLFSGPDRRRCEEALVSLFDDDDEQVRSEAVHFLLETEAKDRLGEMEPLLHRLIASRAFNEAADRLFRVLDETTAPIADLLFAAVDRFLTVSGPAAADVRTSAAGTAAEASKLLVRAYSQACDASLRARCLDRMDQLIARDAFGLEQAIDDIDR